MRKFYSTGIVALLFCWGLFSHVNAQVPQDIESGFYLDLIAPKGQMAQNLNQHGGLGLRWQIGKRIKQTPFTVGGELSTYIFGCQMWEGYLNEYETAEFIQENHLLSGNVWGRFQPWRNGLLQPYLEARLGGRMFYTSLMARGINEAPEGHCPEENIIFDEIIQRDFALFYAFGGGIQMPLFQFPDGGQGVYLDYNLMYNGGSVANYMGATDASKIYTSKTNLWTLGAGLVVKF